MRTKTDLHLAVFIGSLFLASAVLSQTTALDVSVSTLPLTSEMKSWGRIGGVATDNSGYVYVANFGSIVWQVSPTGDVREIAHGLYGASGNAIDRNGDLLQAGHFNGRLYRIARDGEKSLVVDGELEGPVGVAVNSAGEIFVANCWAPNIAKVGEDSSVSIFSSEPVYACPNGLTFDSNDNLYVVDFDNTVITKVEPDGSASTLAILPGVGNGHIAWFNNFLYVTQFRQHRVYRVSLDGEFDLIVGSGEPGHEDGIGAEAKLAWPNGIAVANGNLYVNTLEGAWRERTSKSHITLRVIELPTLLRTVSAALENNSSDDDLRRVVERYLLEYQPNMSTETVISSLDSTATRLIARGRADQALRIAKLAIEMDADSSAAWVALGDVYSQLDDPHSARTNYAKALELDPGNVSIEARLKSVAAR